MGLDCIYRPPLTSLETDSSVLARLSHLEARVQAIDHGRSEALSFGTPATAPEGSVILAWPKVPEFHHAAAHKLFHYWSKLRINLTIPDIEPLKFLKQVDEADDFLFSSHFATPVSGDMPLAEAIRAIESLFENILRLPFVLRHLLTYGGLSKDICLGFFKQYRPSSPQAYQVRLEFKNQSAEELLLQTVAFKHVASTTSEPYLSQKADLCFRRALERMWMMQTQQSPQALPFKFLFVIILLYLYGRPFHALGLLQSLESLIHNASPKSQEDLAFKSRYEACLHQYFILESDILTEIDGIPSQRLHNIGVSLANDTVTTPPNLFGHDFSAPPGESHPSWELQAHLRLRGYLNSVLDNLYTANRAYCRPDDVAEPLTDIARRLDLWYWSLPLDMRFPRHPSAFLFAANRMSAPMDEVMFRYYAAVFLMNRPILYSVLYETLEHAARSPESEASKQDPWTYESCYNCVQNAIMIILLHTTRHHTNPHDYFENWCNLQHLIAAHAIIVQVRNSPTMSILLRDSGDPSQLLDAAENVLERCLNRPATIRETLGLLRNIRQNFQRNTPRTPSLGNGYATSPVYSAKS
ncbi:uncharacterized protein Z518_09006 [Rhinocladiella mackenziei CBS 650.93]|uniref:Rhinocladiella mackenziei CBS 650.93 unplaced genomic scaffold supercont1.7, whole genome shotgun sequence n=1 Tax=Rhinocladiella mackenziei CBS 650.93 TaxID=1442369 RepID=A0A0D2IDG8_9EURO|nr:uncharacterized protein Z518_09006 [Rhinocladiella mackenziei CBS 650.93]KIX01281.1 hypothetical protein Z518_09006 [Rhinocladiella mackenziei CBS 650.93]